MAAGDTKTIRGIEYESTGDKNPTGLSQDRPTPLDPDEWPHETKDKDGNIEYWRRKKPTS